MSLKSRQLAMFNTFNIYKKDRIKVVKALQTLRIKFQGRSYRVKQSLKHNISITRVTKEIGEYEASIKSEAWFIPKFAHIPGLCLSIVKVDDKESDSMFIVFRYRIKATVKSSQTKLTTSCDFLDISITEYRDPSYILNTCPMNHGVFE